MEFITSLTEFTRSLNLPAKYDIIYFIKLYDKVTKELLFYKVGMATNTYVRFKDYFNDYFVNVCKLYLVSDAKEAENIVHKNLRESGHILIKGNEYYKPTTEEDFINCIETSLQQSKLFIQELTQNTINNIYVNYVDKKSDEEILKLFSYYVENEDNYDEEGNLIKITNINNKQLYNIISRLQEVKITQNETKKKHLTELIEKINNIIGYDIVRQVSDKVGTTKLSTRRWFDEFKEFVTEFGKLPSDKQIKYKNYEERTLIDFMRKVKRGDRNANLREEMEEFIYNTNIPQIIERWEKDLQDDKQNKTLIMLETYIKKFNSWVRITTPLYYNDDFSDVDLKQTEKCHIEISSYRLRYFQNKNMEKLQEKYNLGELLKRTKISKEDDNRMKQLETFVLTFNKYPTHNDSKIWFYNKDFDKISDKETEECNIQIKQNNLRDFVAAFEAQNYYKILSERFKQLYEKVPKSKLNKGERLITSTRYTQFATYVLKYKHYPTFNKKMLYFSSDGSQISESENEVCNNPVMSSTLCNFRKNYMRDKEKKDEKRAEFFETLDFIIENPNENITLNDILEIFKEDKVQQVSNPIVEDRKFYNSLIDYLLDKIDYAVKNKIKFAEVLLNDYSGKYKLNPSCTLFSILKGISESIVREYTRELEENAQILKYKIIENWKVIEDYSLVVNTRDKQIDCCINFVWNLMCYKSVYSSRKKDN